MTRPWNTVIPLLVLVAAGCATGPETGPSAEQRYAILDTSGSRRAEGIFPVLITEIDDKTVNSSAYDLRHAKAGFPNGRTVFRVRPGVHRIKALAYVDRTWVRGLTRDISRSSNEPLEENFQSGRRYFIGLKADSGRRADWRLVIWKTEDVEEGTLDLGDD